MPNNSLMKSAAATASCLAIHLTRPFRIMFTASIPCNVRHAVGNFWRTTGLGGARKHFCAVRRYRQPDATLAAVTRPDFSHPPVMQAGPEIAGALLPVCRQTARDRAGTSNDN